MKRFATIARRFALGLMLATSLVSAQGVYVNDSGTLREITGIYVNDSGTLREIQTGWINDSGTLRQFYSSLVVELANKFHSTQRIIEGVAVANVRVSSDGNYYQSNEDGFFSIANELWLESGAASAVWVERTIDSGTLDTDDIGAGRVNLGAGNFDIGVSSAFGGVQNATFTLNFYNASSGGTLLDTAQISVSGDGSTT